MNSKLRIDNQTSIEFRKVPHALVSGITGSGKTTLMQLLILRSLSVTNGLAANVFIVDNKRSDLYAYRRMFSDGKKRVFSTPQNVAKFLRIMTNNLNLRYEHSNGNLGSDFVDYKLRPCVVVIDELAALFAEAGQIRKEIEGYLLQLVLKGRQMGFFVIVGTQRVSTQVMDSDVRAQFGNRIILGAADRETLRMIFPTVAYDEIPNYDHTSGSGLIMQDTNGLLMPKPFKCPNIYELDIPKIVRKIELDFNASMFQSEEEYWQNM